jgi:enoyl-CoA hydratase
LKTEVIVTMTSFSCLKLSAEGPVVMIRLTRPDLHNRFDAALHTEFPAALAEASAWPDIAALLITAEGKSFSVGGDLHMMLEANGSPVLRDRLKSEAIAIVDGLIDFPAPVIAAVKGNAIGLGATIVACCDMVVASRNARIADPHVMLGLAAGDGGVLGWSQSVGVLRAKRYLLTGEALTGEQAHAIGLVSDLVETAPDCEPAGWALANKIAALPRGGIAATKRAFSQLVRDQYRAAFLLSLDLEMETLAGPEVLGILEQQLSGDR